MAHMNTLIAYATIAAHITLFVVVFRINYRIMKPVC